MPDRKNREYMDDDDTDVAPLSFDPAVLGLHRVGTILPPKPQPKQPIQVLNARGMPARIRKRNKLFYDDDIVNDNKTARASLSPRKPPKSTSPVKIPIKILKKRKGVISKYMKTKEEEKDDEQKNSKEPSPVQPMVIPVDKKIGQEIGLRLRNLLKLPKAHRWVSFEWFYSFIDKPLFDSDNEFERCLRNTFPKLKTRMLTRIEWTTIRKILGKPRRFSAAFLQNERRQLERRRQKIRLLQTRKCCDNISVKDLPAEIPLPLPIGTKVTARLKKPQDGLFFGTVDAIDSLTSSYRIIFDRPGLGTHSVPDYELVANDFHETISLSSLTQDLRPRLGLNGNVLSSPGRAARNALNKSDPLLGQSLYNSHFKNPVLTRETIGHFPIKLLEAMMRLKKTISAKTEKLSRLRSMNIEAEFQKGYGHKYTNDFQRRYASTIISIEKLNREMQDFLSQIQTQAREVIKEPHILAILTPSYLKEKCRGEVELSVSRNNPNLITDPKMIGVITSLATLLLVTSQLATEESINVKKILEGCIDELRGQLEPENVEIFHKSIHLHMHHIKLGLSQITNRKSIAAIMDVDDSV